MTLAAALLCLLAGCSSNTPQKSAEEPKVAAPQPVAVGQTPPLPPAAAASATATESPKPKAKEADTQKKETPKPKPETGSAMDRFAKCLADRGAAMYGVFWCDHCREQKEKFGDSFKYVKYVECVTPDAPRTLIPECKAQDIKHTPTWIFSDGERVEGVMGIDQLAMKTHCKMP